MIQFDAFVLPITSRSICVACLTYHAEASIMSASEPNIFNIVKPKTHLWNDKRIFRDFKHDFSIHYSLKVHNRGNCKIQILPPATYHGIPLNYFVIILSKETTQFFPSIYKI